MNKLETDKKTGVQSIPGKPYAKFSTLPSRTKQSFRQEADINHIYKRALANGYLPPSRRQPVYGDVSSIPSYEESFNRVRAAQDAFMRLPSQLRAKMDNDPKNLLNFLKNPENRELAEKYGLLKKQEKKENESKNKNQTPPAPPQSSPPPPPPPVS